MVTKRLKKIDLGNLDGNIEKKENEDVRSVKPKGAV